MLADASPSTPPAGKPSLSPPPPDTPCESSTAGSVTSDKPNYDDVTAASSHNNQHGAHNHNGISHTNSLKATFAGSSLHANARAFVPNVNAPAFVPSSAHHINVASYMADGHAQNGYANGHLTGFSPSALSGTSPHAAWDEAAVSEASGYQNGWYEGYGGYADPYVGYGYGAMTPDGLFVPQQVNCKCKSSSATVSQARRSQSCHHKGFRCLTLSQIRSLLMTQKSTMLHTDACTHLACPDMHVHLGCFQLLHDMHTHCCQPWKSALSLQTCLVL